MISVQPFPATGALYQLFAKGADDPHPPLWSPDEKPLFHNPRPGGFGVVTVTTQPPFAFGNPGAVPRVIRVDGPTMRRGVDITPSGKFLGLIAAAQPQQGTPDSSQISGEQSPAGMRRTIGLIGRIVAGHGFSEVLRLSATGDSARIRRFPHGF
jgi:hypothetical protein